MPFFVYIAWFVGGLFLINAVPHMVSGLLGRPFPSPFTKPPGKGLSSPVSNVAWAFINLVIAWALLARVGDFHIVRMGDALSLGLGMLLGGLALARHFGRLDAG